MHRHWDKRMQTSTLVLWMTTTLHIPLSTTELVKFTRRCSSGSDVKLQLLETGSGLLVLRGACSWWWWRWLGSGISLALFAGWVCEWDTDACCISCRTTVSSRRVHVLSLGSMLAGFSSPKLPTHRSFCSCAIKISKVTTVVCTRANHNIKEILSLWTVTFHHIKEFQSFWTVKFYPLYLHI